MVQGTGAGLTSLTCLAWLQPARPQAIITTVRTKQHCYSTSTYYYCNSTEVKEEVVQHIKRAKQTYSSTSSYILTSCIRSVKRTKIEALFWRRKEYTGKDLRQINDIIFVVFFPFGSPRAQKIQRQEQARVCAFVGSSHVIISYAQQLFVCWICRHTCNTYIMHAYMYKYPVAGV